MADPVCVVSEFFARDMSESDTIKSCEIGRDFAGHDDIVRGECIVCAGK